MKKLLNPLLLLAGSIFLSSPLPLVAQVGIFPDYCSGNANYAKLTASVSITTATTTAVVPATTGKYTHVCAVILNVVGTSPTVQFKTGTQVSTACDTGAVNLTGAMPVATGTQYPVGPGMTQFSSALSGQVCLVTGGTVSGTGTVGYIIYVSTGN
jgi:hypothetical protein